MVSANKEPEQAVTNKPIVLSIKSVHIVISTDHGKNFKSEIDFGFWKIEHTIMIIIPLIRLEISIHNINPA